MEKPEEGDGGPCYSNQTNKLYDFVKQQQYNFNSKSNIHVQLCYSPLDANQILPRECKAESISRAQRILNPCSSALCAYKYYIIQPCGAWWLSGRFGALRPKGRRFESHSSRRVEILPVAHRRVNSGTVSMLQSGAPLSSSGLDLKRSYRNI